MFSPGWKNETTKTNGEMKPCQSPSQNPATVALSLAVPLNALGPGAQAARMRRKVRARMKAVSFMGPPVRDTRRRGKKTHWWFVAVAFTTDGAKKQMRSLSGN